MSTFLPTNRGRALCDGNWAINYSWDENGVAGCLRWSMFDGGLNPRRTYSVLPIKWITSGRMVHDQSSVLYWSFGWVTRATRDSFLRFSAEVAIIDHFSEGHNKGTIRSRTNVISGARFPSVSPFVRRSLRPGQYASLLVGSLVTDRSVGLSSFFICF